MTPNPIRDLYVVDKINQGRQSSSVDWMILLSAILLAALPTAL